MHPQSFQDSDDLNNLVKTFSGAHYNDEQYFSHVLRGILPFDHENAVALSIPSVF